PAVEGEMMSGDDALAWLASLAAGKEEELRAQAEAETRARVDEIMGRKPTAPLLAVEPEAPAPVIEEPVVAEAPAPGEGIALEAEELEPVAEEMAAIMPAAEEEIPAIAEAALGEDFFGWSGFEPEVAEAETTPEPEILEAETLTPASFAHPGPESQAPPDQKPEEIKIAEPVLAEPEASTVTQVAPPTAAPAPAVDALRTRLQADPKDYPSRLELARALVSQDAIQEAVEHYGRLVRERQSLADIEADLTQLLEQQPNDPRPLQTLGDLNMQNGRLDKAMEFYKRALSQL
ncbi:MAG: tetratricopeptide repeat protein, partial [Anaerolineae bacterium]|nr:tetratricopeptide repeat protein [Anaerolineae bacterium]